MLIYAHLYRTIENLLYYLHNPRRSYVYRSLVKIYLYIETCALVSSRTAHVQYTDYSLIHCRSRSFSLDRSWCWVRYRSQPLRPLGLSNPPSCRTKLQRQSEWYLSTVSILNSFWKIPQKKLHFCLTKRSTVLRSPCSFSFALKLSSKLFITTLKAFDSFDTRIVVI